MAKLSIRVVLEPAGAIGPGKIRLLELVGETGSIAAAGRAMRMSYRRAWILVDDVNQLFNQPVVSTSVGGKSGGGAALTTFGQELVRRYRAIEAEAANAASAHLAFIQAEYANRPPSELLKARA